MHNRVDLIVINQCPQPINWPLGPIHYTSGDVKRIHDIVTRSDISPTAWLFWDGRIGEPDPMFILRLLSGQGDVWHAGLKLGTSGLPKLIDTVMPISLLNLDVDTDVNGVSWRISAQCCLVRADVLHHDPIPQGFSTLSAAMLSAGFRWIMSGVIIYFIPDLLPYLSEIVPLKLTSQDELLFIRTNFNRWQYYWAAIRAIASKRIRILDINNVIAIAQVTRNSPTPYLKNNRQISEIPPPLPISSVSVVIPTLGRYSYLRTLLIQLSRQTVLPHQVIIVDQTPQSERDTRISTDFADIPIQYLFIDSIGQCVARNAALLETRGEFVLFLDDDDEVHPTLIEDHLKTLQYFQSDSSSGSIVEPGGIPLTREYQVTRISDVFPTNNTMLRFEALRKSGLFDMAFNKRQSEDGDLGIRLYLAGATLLYNPQISVLHHRAPSGGLREHKARVITHSSSRQKLFHRRFPHISEVYLAKRYFTPGQVREALLLSIVGTFSVRGGIIRKLLKIFISTLLLPNSLYQIKKRLRGAEELLKLYPQIPSLLGQQTVRADSRIKTHSHTHDNASN